MEYNIDYKANEIWEKRSINNPSWYCIKKILNENESFIIDHSEFTACNEPVTINDTFFCPSTIHKYTFTNVTEIYNTPMWKVLSGE